MIRSTMDDKSRASLSTLDLERQDSMADEGGVSAALLDIEDLREQRLRHRGSRPQRAWRWIVAGAVGGIVLAGIGRLALAVAVPKA